MVWHNTSLGMDCFDRGVVTAYGSGNASIAGRTEIDYDRLNELAAVDIAGSTGSDYDTKTISKITLGGNTFHIADNVSIAAVDDLKIDVDKIGAALKAIANYLKIELDEENNVIEKVRGMGRLRRSQLRTL